MTISEIIARIEKANPFSIREGHPVTMAADEWQIIKAALNEREMSTNKGGLYNSEEEMYTNPPTLYPSGEQTDTKLLDDLEEKLHLNGDGRNCKLFHPYTDDEVTALCREAANAIKELRKQVKQARANALEEAAGIAGNFIRTHAVAGNSKIVKIHAVDCGRKILAEALEQAIRAAKQGEANETP